MPGRWPYLHRHESVAPSHLARVGRRIGSLVLAAGLTVGGLAGPGAVAASAATECDPGADVCVILPDSVQTPLGLVTVTVSDASVVTVRLDPTTSTTRVFGVPFSYPQIAGCPGGCSRTTIDTSGGLVTIDTIQIPPGPPGRLAVPNLAIISIHPPGPCRARTSGTTVVFTPIIPPGPPG